MTVKNSSTKSGGCGCGGRGSGTSGSTSSCGCGGTCGGSCGCESCASQGFARPRFFAGQLLTEEDLDLLSDYIVGKNRLRNRTLVGDGVVCGLEVTCNPCGGGSVVVHPGSAIDCCGNDIVVPCAQTLDINAMVRKLRIESLGADCGDPCASPDATVDDAVPTPYREFGLYLRYCETLTDPVAAYSTDEACGAQACEPTRVKEGFRFELRCPSAGDTPDGFLTRVFKCLGDAAELEKTLADLKTIETSAYAVSQAKASIVAEKTVTFGQAESLQLAKYTTQLQQWNQSADPKTFIVGKAAAVDPKAAAAGEVSPKPAAGGEGDAPPPPPPAPAAPPATRPAAPVALDASALSMQMRMAVDTAGLIARYTLAPANAKEDPQVERQLRGSQAALQQTSTRLTLQLQDMPDSMDKAWGLAAMQAIATVPITKVPRSGPVYQQMQFMSQGVVYNAAMQNTEAARLQEIQRQLLDQLDQSSDLADCALRDALKKVVVQLADGDGLIDTVNPNFDKTPGRIISDAYQRVLRNCLCLALLPPCAPCDDPAVLLACVQVEDCVVTDICNLKRKFVLSGPAFRYWLPLHMIGKLLELACCPSDCGAPKKYTVSSVMGQMIGKSQGVPQPMSASTAPIVPKSVMAAAPMVASLYTPKTVDVSALEHLTRAAIDATDIVRLHLGAEAFPGAFSAGSLDVSGGGERGRVGVLGGVMEAEVNKRVNERMALMEDRVARLEKVDARRRKSGPVN